MQILDKRQLSATSTAWLALITEDLRFALQTFSQLLAVALLAATVFCESSSQVLRQLRKPALITKKLQFLKIQCRNHQIFC